MEGILSAEHRQYIKDTYFTTCDIFLAKVHTIYIVNKYVNMLNTSNLNFTNTRNHRVINNFM